MAAGTRARRRCQCVCVCTKPGSGPATYMPTLCQDFVPQNATCAEHRAVACPKGGVKRRGKALGRRGPNYMGFYLADLGMAMPERPGAPTVGSGGAAVAAEPPQHPWQGVDQIWARCVACGKRAPRRRAGVCGHHTKSPYVAQSASNMAMCGTDAHPASRSVHHRPHDAHHHTCAVLCASVGGCTPTREKNIRR